MKTTIVADLFCGAGGTSIGAHQTGGVDIAFAVNHWHTAIQTHSANFPKAHHVETPLKRVSPSECQKKINLLFASPECTHHSRARGGRPTSDQQRSGAWDILPWIEYHRPSHIVVENVTEFEDWGPVDPKTNAPYPSMRGNLFHAWVSAIESAGYKVSWRKLNAADFGAATSRERLFVICRRGNRQPCFPEPSHCKDSRNCLPGFEQPHWRGAIEVIDWSIPLPSVFARKRPLADNTLSRIEKGLDRHVAPFMVTLRNHCHANEADNPLGTITADGLHHAVACPMLLSAGGREIEGRLMDGVMPTLLTHENLAIACPFITSFYGTQNTSTITQSVPTVTTKEHHALTVPFVGDLKLPEARTDAERSLQAKMSELGVFDIGFRMLSNGELADAQGFPMDYTFCGNKKEVTRQIGNSVSPPVAKAITEALLGA